MMRPIRSVLVLALVIISIRVASEDLWYYSYDQAKKAMAAGDWATAETKMLLAKKNGPPSSKREKAYGTRFIAPWVPDYYLGIIYFNQKKNDQARTAFDVVSKSAILQNSDPEFSEMQRMIALLGPAGPGPEQQPETFLVDAEKALSKGQLRNARQLVRLAQSKAPGNQRAAAVLSRIEQKEISDQQSVQRLIEQGRLDEARRTIQLIVQADPSRPKINSFEEAISRKENEYRDLAAKAKTEPEVLNALKTIQNLSSNNPDNKVFATLFAELNQKSDAIKLSRDKELKEKKLAEFAEFLKKGNDAYNQRNFEEARRFAQKAMDTGVDEKKAATQLINNISAAEFQAFMRSANLAYGAKKYKEAREFATRADLTQADKGGAAKVLLKKIDIDENLAAFDQARKENDVEKAQQAYKNIARLDPGNPRWNDMMAWINQAFANVSADQREQLAIISFYSGYYENAKTLLDQMEMDKGASAKTYFYLGCTNAAIALMKDLKERKPLLQKATQYFAKVRSLDPKFSYYDETVISPKILGIYLQTR